MRVFYLRLTKSSFSTILQNQWQTTAFDLYHNSSYENYSTVKSFYGKQTTPTDWSSNQKYPWTGLTDSDGIITNGRYIDYTGPINIIGYTLVTSVPYLGNTTVDISLSPINSQYLDEWASSTGYTQAGGINLTGVDRYVQFNLNFDIYPGDDAILYIRVEIGPPIIAPKYEITQEILNNFPKWMAVREYDQESYNATPQLATPMSLGGGIINAVAGEWLEDLRLRIRDQSADMYLPTVDLNQMAWCYKTTGVPQYLYSIVGDGNTIGLAWDVGEFYEADSTEYVAYWDEDNQYLFCNKEFNTLLLNGVVYKQVASQVWNALDELGLLVDLSRLPLENNVSFQSRLYDVFINPLGAGLNSFKLALRRELDMWSIYGSTPNSSYLGATPDVLEVSDIETDPTFTNPSGLPTSKFLALADSLATQYPATWGHFQWDNMLWDVGGTDYSGFTVLPRQFDATPLVDSMTQSGVGDGDDLLVYGPNEAIGPHSFEANLVARGKQAIQQTLYPPADLTLQIQGTATRTNYDNPAVSVWFTIEVLLLSDVNDATPSAHEYFYSFQLTSTSNIDLYQSQPTASSFASMELVNANGFINPSFNLASKYLSNGQLVNLGQALDSSLVDSIKIQLGQWDVVSGSYINFPGSPIFTAWLSNNTSTTMTYGGTPLSITNNISSPVEFPRVSLMMSSNETSSSIGEWNSEIYTYPITINNDPDIAISSSVTVQLPTINWDPYATGNQNYAISIVSNNGGVIPEYGALVRPLNGNPFYLNTSYILLNGSSTWIGNKQTIAATTTNIELSLATGPLYPVVDNLWEPYTSNTYSITGTVDENGPWVNGIAPPLGVGNNDQLIELNLTRSDFGVPESNNYIINWIGVSTNDGQVVAWLDSNTIIPYNTTNTTSYPTNAIIENLSNNKYIYSPFPLYVRLMPGNVPQWYPQVNSGTFFEGQQEYYLYADQAQETATMNMLTLAGPSRQGAPIIIRTDQSTPTYFRQVTFFDDSSTPDYTQPTSLTLTNTEVVYGTGMNYLLASYPDIYNISVIDVTIPTAPVQVSITESAISNNMISTASATSINHSYQLTYIVHNSFMVDNTYIDTLGNQRALLTLDATPATPATPYTVSYEQSIFNSATPIPVPLNPLYTNLNEGFLFISHEEYPIEDIIISINPSKLVANGRDYLSINIQSIDNFGNPKPNQVVTVATTYGVLSSSKVQTNNDGYASVLLTTTNESPTGTVDPVTLLPQGVITVVGEGVSNSTTFLVETSTATPNKIYAVVSQDQIPADGVSQNVIYGKVYDQYSNAVPNAYIEWTKARSNFELFESITSLSGQVLADNNGTFTIGPFPSDTESGYWFMSTETNSASPNITYSQIGDVVYWYEYSPSIYGINNMNGLPTVPVQLATPVGTLPSYSYGNFYPANYDEIVEVPTSPVGIPVIHSRTNEYDQLISSLKPIGWWKLNDPISSGIANDSSGNDLIASVMGHPTFAQSGPIPRETGVWFNGSTDFMQTGKDFPVINLSTGFTLIIWVKDLPYAFSPPSTPEGTDIAGWTDTTGTSSFLVSCFNVDNSLGIQGGNFTASTPNTIPSDDNWHMLVLTLIGTAPAQSILYCDATPILDSSGPVNVTNTTGIFGMNILGYQYNTEGQLYGLHSGMAQVALFNKVLTSGQIETLYKSSTYFDPIPNVISPNQYPYPEPYVNPDAATPIIYWVPPDWYALPQYTQYQLGLTYLGDEHVTEEDV